MLSRPGRLAVAVAAACLLAGCQPPAPTTTPVPTYQCTPEAGGAEFGCSQHQYDDMVAKDKLYAEAEAVYRKFFAEDVRIYRSGGVVDATPPIIETTTGDFYADSLDLYQSLKRTKTRVVGGEIRLVSLVRAPGSTKAGSIVAMKSCVDGSTTEIRSPGEKAEKGAIGSDLLYFVRVDGLLKIGSADGQEVKSC
jgi:hypothetical protein